MLLSIRLLLFLSINVQFAIIRAQFENVLPQDCQERYCYDLDEFKTHRNQLGTKTPYPRYTDFDVNREFTVPNCKPVKMWILIRHGARAPTSSELDKFRRLNSIHDQFIEHYKTPRKRHRCNLCEADVQLLKNWSFRDNMSDIEANVLLPQGFADLKRLGANLPKMFPTLFEKYYSEKDYLFLYAKESRTKSSYKAFVEGLFGSGAGTYIKPRHSKDDRMLLQAYEYCKHSVKNSDKVDNKNGEPDKFERSSIFNQVIRDASFKLGFETPLNISTFKQIWNWCTYEASWSSDKPSPWCVVFSPLHYYPLDYKEDISYYYKKSYGSNVNLKLACHTMNDMLYHLDNYDTFKVVAYFVHSTLMQLFFTSMGAMKDKEHLRADNYHRMFDRKFRSSNVLPLASNLAAIKYECNHTDEKDQILFLLNQKPLNFEWCKGSLCPLSLVKKKYAKFAEMDCSETYCDPNFPGFEPDHANGETDEEVMEYVTLKPDRFNRKLQESTSNFANIIQTNDWNVVIIFGFLLLLFFHRFDYHLI